MKPSTTIVFMVLITSLTNGCWSGAEGDFLQGGSLEDCECGFKCNGKYCVCKTCNDKKSNLGIENDLEDSNPTGLGKSKISSGSCIGRDCKCTPDQPDQLNNCEKKCLRVIPFYDDNQLGSGECLYNCFKDECKSKFCTRCECSFKQIKHCESDCDYCDIYCTLCYEIEFIDVIHRHHCKRFCEPFNNM